MRKLKLQVQISIDGYIAGPNGEMNWVEWNWGDDINEYVAKINEPINTIVLGRKLAEGFIPTWEARLKESPDDAGAQKFTQTPKVVFTKTIFSHDWNNTTLANGDITEEINKLKNRGTGDIMAYGGAKFVSSLLREGLIDELYLFVNPAALGKGMPVFEDLRAMQKLRLLEARSFDCGICVLNYSKTT